MKKPHVPHKTDTKEKRPLWAKLGCGITILYEKAQQKPIQQAVLLFVLYMLMDAQLLNVYGDLEQPVVFTALLLTFGLFYLFYVHGYVVGKADTSDCSVPLITTHPRRYTIVIFIGLMVAVFTLFFTYDIWLVKWFPNMEETYYQSQVFHLLVIAPITEELCFRYFLYDKWARPKLGIVKGILLTSLLFVLCHPVVDMNGIILYWVPTLLFYVMYHSGGLYTAIIAHMIFNFIAA